MTGHLGSAEQLLWVPGARGAGTVTAARWQTAPQARSLLCRSPKIYTVLRYASHPPKNSCVWMLAFLGGEEHFFLLEGSRWE